MAPQRLSLLPWPVSRWVAGGVLLGALAAAGCTTQSVDSSVADTYEARLADHLAATGSVMYGAYWCPHCADQKELFQQAADQMPYVECAADGDNAQPELCQQKGIQAYPTWEIGGQLHLGVQSLNELATMTGFEVPQ